MSSRHHLRRPVLNPEGWSLLSRWIKNKARDPRVLMWALGTIALMSMVVGVMLVANNVQHPAGLLLFAAVTSGTSWMYMVIRLS